MDIKNIIDGCLKNNKKSEYELYKCCKSVAHKTVKQYIKNDVLLDDVIQEGFIRLYKNISKYDFEGSFEGWVYRIFRNISIDYLRKKKIVFEYNDRLEVVDNGYDHTIDERLKGIKDLVKTLPESYKIVTTLYYYEGLKHREIAEKIDINEGTSKAYLHRAKGKIIKKLKNKEYV
jgi:RNA polymerase sigma-70 factor (ECF subfamily)